MNYIEISGSYGVVNTECLRYKNQSVSAIREIIAVCSGIHVEHVNTSCGDNVKFLNVKPGDI